MAFANSARRICSSSFHRIYLEDQKVSFSAKKKRPASIMAELATQQTRWQRLPKTTKKYEHDSTWVTSRCHITKLEYAKLKGALHTHLTSSPWSPFENVFPDWNEAWLIMTQLIIVCKSFQLTSWSIVRAGLVHVHPKKKRRKTWGEKQNIYSGWEAQIKPQTLNRTLPVVQSYLLHLCFIQPSLLSSCLCRIT